MSFGYSIHGRIKAGYSRETISDIFMHGQKIGLSYYRSNPDIWEIGFIDSPLELNQAVDWILQENQYGGHSIYVKKDDTYILTSVSTDESYMEISFVTFFYPWLKNFDDREEDDIGRYGKLFLDFTANCEILEVAIIKDKYYFRCSSYLVCESNPPTVVH